MTQPRKDPVTIQQACRDLVDAWREFVEAFAVSLKLDVALRKLERWLWRLKSKRKA